MGRVSRSLIGFLGSMGTAVGEWGIRKDGVERREVLGIDSNLSSIFFPINRPGEIVEGAAKELTDDNGTLIMAVYLFCSICFIFSLKGLGSPRTALRGNYLGMIGMLTSVLVSCFESGFGSRFTLLILSILPSALIGISVAQYVQMVSLPQLVAFFHSFVGLAAMLIGFAHYEGGGKFSCVELLEMHIGIFIASVTLSGSLVAAGKLQGWISENEWALPGRNIWNGGGLLLILLSGCFLCSGESHTLHRSIYVFNTVVSLLLGVHLVGGIGGADMPVVVSMLNSYSGFAAAASGFVLDNTLLILCGCLIGSSGAILSYVMCKGMNRNFVSVILGGWESVSDIEGQETVGTVQETFVEEVSRELMRAESVLIVPGYGMAASQAQHSVARLYQVLRSSGKKVEFAVHPVAGRMPGHMNVLLAEAGVPYSCVKESDDVNKTIGEVDVALVVGANDIVNPLSLRSDSKIGGMPTVHVWMAKRCVVCKRSLAAGYAAIDNPLFGMEKTRLLFGDAKTVITKLDAQLEIEAKPQVIQEEQVEQVQEQKHETFPDPRLRLGILPEPEECELTSVTPHVVTKFRKMAVQVLIPRGAAVKAGFTDSEYLAAGAELAANEDDILKQAQGLVRLTPPSPELIKKIKPETVLFSFFWPGKNPAILRVLSECRIIAIALDEIPRTLSKGQRYDIRTTLASVQGYRAAIEAIHRLPTPVKGAATAAGNIPPPQFLVVGAGIAGLQAMATAKSMGAHVIGTDVREASKDEVESCGAKWLKIDIKESGTGIGGYAKEMSTAYQNAQKDAIQRELSRTQVLITAANVPNAASPKIINTEMLRLMPPNSVVIDMAAGNGDTAAGWGGNVQCTVPDQIISVHKTILVGIKNYEHSMKSVASQLIANNIFNLVHDVVYGDRNQQILPSRMSFNPIHDDPAIMPMIITFSGLIRYVPPEKRPPPPPEEKPTPPTIKIAQKSQYQLLIESDTFFFSSVLLCALLSLVLGFKAQSLDVKHLFLAALSLLIGYHTVWSVAPALHTPLMSVTNAISGVVIIGAMLEFHNPNNTWALIFAAVAAFFSAINVFGGFAITSRMLAMFQVGESGHTSA